MPKSHPNWMSYFKRWLDISTSVYDSHLVSQRNDPFTLVIALFIFVWPHQATADPLPQHDILPGENPTVCGSRCEEPNAPCSYPGDDGVIRIETALHQSGSICVRVENATDVALFHGIPGAPGRTDLRVERHVRAGRWRRAAPTGQSSFTLAYRSPWIQTVAPHSYFHPSLLLYNHRDLPPGRYRVCFRFWQGNRTETQVRCARPFAVPSD